MVITYADNGREPISSLTDQVISYFYPSFLQAESPDESSEINTWTVNGQGVLGGYDGKYIVFKEVYFDNLEKIVMKAYQPENRPLGGYIEFRMDSLDGSVLKTVNTEDKDRKTGDYQTTVEIQSSSGRHDLYIRFTNNGNPDQLISVINGFELIYKDQ